MLSRFWGLLLVLLCSGLAESSAQYRQPGPLAAQAIISLSEDAPGHSSTAFALSSPAFAQSSPAFAQSSPAFAQSSPAFAQSSPSTKKALLLSLLLPGLGHRYVNDGSWAGVAAVLTAIDVGLWTALIGGEWRRDHLTSSYTTLASSQAAADVNGKDRFFFLNLATYRSSDEFRETALRNRAWDQIDYVEDASFQWSWSDQSDFERFRSLREDAESLRRRRVVIVASLVVNRLISGLTAARRAGNRDIQLSLGPPVRTGLIPSANLNVRF